MAASGRAWRWLQRAAGALLLLLLSLEAALQIAALFVGDGRHAENAVFRSDRHRVLFLGDSNTWGLYVERTEAYPVVFERAWNARHPERPIEVLNLAYPGTNSSYLLRGLPKILRATRPDTLMVMVGVNDFWTQPASDASPGARLGERLWKWSRAYRFLFLLRRSFEGPPQVDVPGAPRDVNGSATLRYGDEGFEVAWRRFDEAERPLNAELAAALASNLRAIVSTTREAGVEVVLLAYPSESERHFYAWADQQIREVAKAEGVPLVDLGFRFRFLCPEGRCAELLEDQHPSASGHELAGRHLAEEARALGLLGRE
jgi:lysophospholipase L1-like esterase